MSQEEITRMAREAGFVGFDGSNAMLRKFAALVAEHERNACAKVCENKNTLLEWPTYAAAIRARGEP
jgi:hypothetical protein